MYVISISISVDLSIYISIANTLDPAPLVGRHEGPAPLRGAGQGDRALHSESFCSKSVL